jgi:16S rRNA processing protein RimM
MGRILGPFGVKGWVRVKTFTGEPAALGDFPRWWVEMKDGWHARALEGFEVHSKGPVAKLAGCDDRDAAMGLQGCDVAVSRSDLGEAGEGEIFWVDLVGLEVVDEAGSALGKVEGLFESGETSVLVVRGQPPRGQARMIPFVPAYVKSVDREARRITVHWKADYDA